MGLPSVLGDVKPLYWASAGQIPVEVFKALVFQATDDARFIN